MRTDDHFGTVAPRTLRQHRLVEPPRRRSWALIEDIHGAAGNLEYVAGTESSRSRALAHLLGAALAHHSEHGDGDCPICGRPGALDAAWRERAEEEVTRLVAEASTADAATAAAVRAAEDAHALLLPLPGALAAARWESVNTEPVATAWAEWATVPKAAAEVELRALADHLEAAGPDLSAATAEVADHAARVLGEREDLWAPVAADVAGWVLARP